MKEKGLEKKLGRVLDSVHSVLTPAGYSLEPGKGELEHWSKGYHHVWISYTTSDRMSSVCLNITVNHRFLAVKGSPGRLGKFLAKAEAEHTEWISNISARWKDSDYAAKSRLIIKKKGEREKWPA